MTSSTHEYSARLAWSGETTGYDSYIRDHTVHVPGKPALTVSADAAFRGNPGAHNPEDLLLVAIASCHMLWYLHLCAAKGVVVLGYEDEATGTMNLAPRAGRFTSLTLNPRVEISADSDASLAEALHERAHAECFIANSLSVPVACHPVVRRREGC